ncbi:MAG: carbohydrate ABC transporter permease [Spirochaetales bacterium]|nr:carbohydrate ABC transporter permease [Spirochaetales bacterium]
MTKKNNALRKTILIIFILFIVIYLIPYLWLIETSVKTRLDAFSMPPKIFFKPIVDNYRTVFFEKNFLYNFRNSIFVTFSVTLISLVIGVPSAYAFSRFQMRGDKIFFFYLLGTRFTPVIVLALPLYFIMSDLKLLNTFAGIIIAHSAFNIAFVIWMMKGFFDTVPKEIDESARVDGCSWFTIFYRIGLPLTAHGIAATSVFCAINSWNEFLMALILTGHNTATMPVALPGLMTPQGTFWGQIAAVGSVLTIPVLIFTFIVQKYMVQGISAGAVK